MNPARLEIQGVPPIAVEALLDYCYKDKLVSASFNILVGAGLTDTMSTKVRTHRLTSWFFPASVVLITKTGTAEICSGDFGTLRTCWAPNISSRCAQRWGWSVSSTLSFKVTILIQMSVFGCFVSYLSLHIFYRLSTAPCARKVSFGISTTQYSTGGSGGMLEKKEFL